MEDVKEIMRLVSTLSSADKLNVFILVRQLGNGRN